MTPSRGGGRLDRPPNGRGKRRGAGVRGVRWPQESPARAGKGLLMEPEHPSAFLLNPANFRGEGCEVNVRKH